MSVETALGLSATLAEEIIERRWDDWTKARHALALADPARLRHWLRAAPVSEANAVLYGLAVLAASEGGDDTEAALVLAWCLLPAACRLANQFSDVDPVEVDHLVASQLWIEIRCYNWPTCRRVTGTICGNVRRGVLREWGLDPDRQPRLTVVTWTDLLAQLCEQPATVELSPRQVLLQVLDWGVASGTIDAVDRALLLDLVDISADDPTHRSPRRSLLGSAVVAAPDFGVTPRTVRRRSRRALDALAARASELTELLDPLAS